jgi:uncharacterized membrane-anchored protein YitT (DUF2179 family)
LFAKSITVLMKGVHREMTISDRLKKLPWHALYDYALILIGSLLVAVSLNAFLIPNRIAAGGVSGLATVVYHLFKFPVGLSMLIFNLPLFSLSYKWIGKKFVYKTAFGTLAISVLVDVFSPVMHPLTSDPLLASLYGGVLTGVGLGLAFRAGGSTGGTDMAAHILNLRYKYPTGVVLLILDGAVIALGGIVFSAELALYALASAYLASRLIDLVIEGHNVAKGAFVISSESEAVAEAVLNELGRGATALEGQGMYTKEAKKVLFIIVSRNEISGLREVVARIDPKAFVAITDVHEVLGEGFSAIKTPS